MEWVSGKNGMEWNGTVCQERQVSWTASLCRSHLQSRHRLTEQVLVEVWNEEE